MMPNPRYWHKGAGAQERAAMEKEPIHDEPTWPSAEHVASLDERLIALCLAPTEDDAA